MTTQWVETALEDVASMCLGKMLDKAKNKGTPRPYLRNANVRWGTFDLSDVQEMLFEDHEAERYTVQQGDVVVCEGGEPGRCAVWIRSDPFYLQKACHRVRCGDRLVPSFLAFQMELFAADGTLSSRFTGSTIKHLPGEVLAALPVRFPTVPEQDRIVAEIETQFTRLDSAVATLERVRANLKHARASVLKAAVEGRLVPTEAEVARAAGRAYEPATVLLDRVLDERMARWPKAKQYMPPVVPETDGLPALPEGWTWATVDQVASHVQYGTSAKCSEEDLGVPVIRMGNLVAGRLDYSNLKYLPANHSEFPDQLLSAGEMLFNRTNSAELVGKSAVFKGYSRPCACASYLVRVGFSARILPEYMTACINSSRGRAWVKAVAIQQVGQANVNSTKLRAHVVPLPPAAEQVRIVAEVERRLSVIDNLDAVVEQNLARCSRLRQSILKQAFEGRLVPPHAGQGRLPNPVEAQVPDAV